MSIENKILILGIGNELLKDDGIGPKIVKDIKPYFLKPNIDFKISALGGMETIEIMRDYDEVVIIDGIFTEGGIPGTVYFSSYPYNKNTLHISNAHDISFDMSVKLARKLSIPVPREIQVIAIEIVEDREFGEELTMPLQERYENILSSIIDMLKRDHVKEKLDCYEKI